jgi:hypothetical protein
MQVLMTQRGVQELDLSDGNGRPVTKVRIRRDERRDDVST